MSVPTPPAPRRPQPLIDQENEFFWEGVKLGELRVQQCDSCRCLIHPPLPHCASCGSFELGYRSVSGRGTVYSHATVHRPLVPPFTEPYSVVVVELAEGIRLVSQLVGVPPGDVAIGLPVEVEFTEVEEGLTLPLFRPIHGESG
ncbi:Zn-ribbon domain-containing OB-fold protein [Streptosporangium sp. CA-115845]|uniref:Zn-ribbon domain-containing OB-fold protein n=1 Tax=Streptosporangium sp. CA-115845 TaxID=3240071 RepID=UPI003D8DC77B